LLSIIHICEWLPAVYNLWLTVLVGSTSLRWHWSAAVTSFNRQRQSTEVGQWGVQWSCSARRWSQCYRITLKLFTLRIPPVRRRRTEENFSCCTREHIPQECLESRFVLDTCSSLVLLSLCICSRYTHTISTHHLDGHFSM